MTAPDALPPEPGGEAGKDDIQADIERTREQLGQTVGALAEKLDVKQRAAETAQSVKAKAVPAVPIAAVVVAAVAAVTGLAIWRRRRKAQRSRWREWVSLS
jgi:hypothetical protein